MLLQVKDKCGPKGKLEAALNPQAKESINLKYTAIFPRVQLEFTYRSRIESKMISKIYRDKLVLGMVCKTSVFDKNIAATH
jgi:hypothetical protein